MARSKRPSIHTVPNPDGGWHSKAQDSNKPFGQRATQAEAIQVGRERARQDRTEHIIHRQDGRIRERNSYGNDPYPPKG